MYAINIADLSRLIPFDAPPFHPYRLLIIPLLGREIVDCEKNRLDGAGVRVKSDDPARWEAVYRIIREGLGTLPPVQKHQLRIYQSQTGRYWRRI